MGLSGHASGDAVIGVTVVLTTLAALAVFARLFARLAVVHNAGLDDAFITAALILSIATTITMCLQGNIPTLLTRKSRLTGAPSQMGHGSPYGHTHSA